MQLLTSFGDTRRSRRRQTYFSTARILALGLVLVGGALTTYQIGRSQSRIELARLQADIAAQQELNRLLSERAATAEQRAEAAIMKSARLQQAYNADVPRGDARALIELLERRLQQGVPADRLAFVLREAQLERKCDKETDTKRLPVHTSAAVVPPVSVTFAGNKIMVTAEGAPLRLPDGRTEASYDPTRPVLLRFLRIGRDLAKIEGRLPLAHATVLGDREYLFAVKAADKPGQIEVVAQACAYP